MSPKDMPAGPVVRRLDASQADVAGLPEWDSSPLGANGLTPMQSRIWVSACAETLVSAGELSLMIVEDDGAIAAIAPLVRRRGAAGPCELLGVRALGEPSDLIFRDEAALVSLVDSVVHECRLLDFQRVPASSPTVAALRAASRGMAVVRVHDANNCPRIVIPANATDTDQLLPSRLRGDLRRARRKADSLGEVTYEICTPQRADEFHALFEQALKVEAAGWKGARGSALAKNNSQAAFFRRYGLLASEAGALRIAFLRIDGVAAAMQYAVEWNGALWLLKVGYDEDFAKCSPGQLLMRRTLQYAVERRLSSYEFLGGEEDWTRRWTEDALKTVRIRIYPLKPLGMAALCRDLVASLREKLSRERSGRIDRLSARDSARSEKRKAKTCTAREHRP